LPGVHQTLHAAISRSVGASEVVPWTTVFPQILEAVQVAAGRGEVARPRAPRTAVVMRENQAFQVTLVRGLVARRFLPQARHVPPDADGPAQLHAVDVPVESGHLGYVVDQPVVGIHFAVHKTSMAFWSETVAGRVELYDFQ